MLLNTYLITLIYFFFQIQIETGSPGLTVAVSVDGKIVWAEGNSEKVFQNLIAFPF